MGIVQEPVTDYVATAANTAVDIHRAEVPGDICVFLPGKREVQRCVDLLKEATQGAAFRHARGRLRAYAFHAGSRRAARALLAMGARAASCAR